MESSERKLSSKPLYNIVLVDKDLFTERQVQILELVFEGTSRSKIKKLLHIKEATMKNHTTNIFDRIDEATTHRPTSLADATAIMVIFGIANLPKIEDN